DLDGESVIEAKGLTDFKVEPFGVLRFDLVVDLFGIVGRSLFQDCGERGTSVFGIDVNAAAENCLMANVAASKIETAFDRKMGFVFDLLGDDFTEDELFGEILGADHNPIFARGAACAEQGQECDDENSTD